MDPIRLGHAYRALRLRRRWRQRDLGARAGVSASVVSRIENGKLDSVSIATLRRLAEALDAMVEVRIRWNGEGLDRLLDQAHAGLVEAFVKRLQAAGWLTEVEVSFSIFGERGSIDVLGYHEAAGIVLVTEVKSVVPDFAGDTRRRRPQGATGAGDRTTARMDVRRRRSTAGDRQFVDLEAARRCAWRDVSKRLSDEWARRGSLVAAAGRADLRSVVRPVLAADAGADVHDGDATGSTCAFGTARGTHTCIARPLEPTLARQVRSRFPEVRWVGDIERGA